MEKLPIYNITLNDSDDAGLEFISLVANPAIMEMGLAFNVDLEPLRFAQVEDKQIVVGAAMIPNVPLYRNVDGFEFYVVFTPEVIEQLSEKFNKSTKKYKINVDHKTEVPSAFIKSNWIIEDAVHDKSVMYGFSYPVGTMMVEVKIEDKHFWNTEVKGNAKFGFSVEGLFGLEPTGLKFNNNEDKNTNEMELTEKEIKMIMDARALALAEEVPASGDTEEVIVVEAEVVVEEPAAEPEVEEVESPEEAAMDAAAVIEAMKPIIDDVLNAIAELKAEVASLKDKPADEAVIAEFKSDFEKRVDLIKNFNAKFNA
jgi:hypothetical protein